VLCAADSQVVLRKSTATWFPSKRPSAPEGERRCPDS
jgi:hypothetical protein